MEQMEQLEIAYQNKDTTSKVLADGSVAMKAVMIKQIKSNT